MRCGNLFPRSLAGFRTGTSHPIIDTVVALDDIVAATAIHIGKIVATI
ncbi:hypothetical protein KHQ06_10200 [Nocardia tengchongensis]|uniref:Uncharacterized protein n=1 Tax=Nocardia tengchongensis TaxID=2055889 RepID=A0ABX8CXL6_9NOCA|nr:hypothetical protein [Nocardia tengchongensis]QVI23235.1 hypothetical protein KHQ06_10200 [Nocardia tengchongensis]